MRQEDLAPGSVYEVWLAADPVTLPESAGGLPAWLTEFRTSEGVRSDTVVVFDPQDLSRLTAYPCDVHCRLDPGTATGLRLDIPGSLRPFNIRFRVGHEVRGQVPPVEIHREGKIRDHAIPAGQALAGKTVPDSLQAPEAIARVLRTGVGGGGLSGSLASQLRRKLCPQVGKGLEVALQLFLFVRL